jgi:hypothetical protein
MPYSYQTHTLTEGSSAGPFSFAAIDDYLSIDHIKVYVDKTLQSTTLYTVNEASKEITFGSALSNGAVVVIRRETPKTTDTREVVFTSGAIVRPDDLNRAHLQTMFIAQETEDYAIKELEPDEKTPGYVLTWSGSDWVTSEVVGGGGGVTPGVKGDINVVTTSDWEIRDGVVEASNLGGDITTAGKNMLKAADVEAQKSLLSLGTAAFTSSTDYATSVHGHNVDEITGVDIVGKTGNYSDLKGTPTEASSSVSGLMSASDKDKLDTVQSGAEPNVQPDWDATTGDAHILNKPTLGTASALDVAPSAGASAGSTQVVRGDDPRLADSRSPTTHGHTAGEITGLATVATSGSYTDLSSKPTIPVNIEDLGNVSNTAPISGQVLKFNGSVWAPGTDNTSGGGGGGGDADTLNGNDGTFYLDRTNHSGEQAISTVTNLQTTLNGKSDVGHQHTSSDITDAGTVITRDVPTSGNAAIVDNVAQVVIADDTRLTDSRDPNAHVHVINDVTDLQSALNDKASSTHTHVLSDITDSGTSAGLDVPETAGGTATSSQVVRGDDPRLSGNAPASIGYYTVEDESATLPNSFQLVAGAGLEQFTSFNTRFFKVVYGNGVGTSCQGDDSRLSDSRTPTAHTHIITDCYVGHVEEPPSAGKDYFLDLEVPVERTVVKITAKTSGGTCNLTFTRDGTTLATITGVNSSIESFVTPAIGNLLSEGETFKMAVSSVNSATDLHFTVRYTQLSGSN